MNKAQDLSEALTRIVLLANKLTRGELTEAEVEAIMWPMAVEVYRVLARLRADGRE